MCVFHSFIHRRRRQRLLLPAERRPLFRTYMYGIYNRIEYGIVCDENNWDDERGKKWMRAISYGRGYSLAYQRERETF
jgi:hypothetical protein